MRLIALLLTGLLAAPPAFAAPQQTESSQQQQPTDSSAAASSTATADAAASGPLPVSLDKIREGIEKPASNQLLKGELSKALDKEPNFRLKIEERQKIEELLSTLNF